MRRLLLALLLLSPLVACTALPTPRQSDERDEDLSELKRRVIELQQQMAVNEVEMARLRERLAELEGRPAPRRSGAEPVSRPASPEARRQGEGRAGAGNAGRAGAAGNEGRAGAAGDEGRAGATGDERRAASGDSPPRGVTEEDVEVEPVPLEAGRVPPAPSTPEGGEPRPPTVEGGEARPTPPPMASGGASEPVSPEARALYDEGFTHFHEGRYVDAETTFQRYLQQFPRTELADNASFWIGEARLQRQDVRGALSAFRQTVERYPEGNKIPDALLKAGECLESLGDAESARLSYQEIVERFPNTAASEVARARMARLTSR